MAVTVYGSKALLYKSPIRHLNITSLHVPFSKPSNYSSIRSCAIYDPNSTISDVAQSFYYASYNDMVTNTSLESLLQHMRPYRIVMTCSENYIAVVFNWLAHYHQICADRKVLYFICLDRYAEMTMKQYGMPCSQTQHMRVDSLTHNKLWVYRVKITRQLLEQGYDVLMSDADAIWLQNPFPYMNNFPLSDIISSRASFPDDVSNRLGATLCLGFIYIKSTNSTKVLWTDFANIMTKTRARPDDQKILNYIIRDNKIEYTIKPTYKGSSHANIGTFKYKGLPMNITLLPHESFRRICDNTTKTDRDVILNSTVSHCLSKKSSGGKYLTQRRQGLWILREDWENQFTGNIDQFLVDIVVAGSVAGDGADGAGVAVKQSAGERIRRRRLLSLTSEYGTRMPLVVLL
eukprot:gene7264-14809_t